MMAIHDGYRLSEDYVHDVVQVIAVAKSSDVVLMVLDASKVHVYTLAIV